MTRTFHQRKGFIDYLTDLNVNSLHKKLAHNNGVETCLHFTLFKFISVEKSLLYLAKMCALKFIVTTSEMWMFDNSGKKNFSKTAINILVIVNVFILSKKKWKESDYYHFLVHIIVIIFSRCILFLIFSFSFTCNII